MPDAIILDDQESNNRGVSIASNNQGCYRVEQSAGRLSSRGFAVFRCIVQNVFESAVQGKGRINGCVHAGKNAIDQEIKHQPW